ncbi:hypothetical protein ACQKWADRAFT_321234 [Trichoderma austrokoningii]
MPRLVRRRPLWERITSNLNPMDFLLWLSEELETRDWDSKLVGTQLGLAMNLVFLLARANAGATSSSDSDIFGDETRTGWFSYVAYLIVWGLALFSGINAAYTYTRTRRYRLFQANVEEPLSTPSARRVQVQSSPVTSASPLRYLADKLAPGSAESRSHPDKKRDVWELAVWDPLPISLRLVCLFSPGHVLAHVLTFPLAPLDPQPSVTVFNAVVMQMVLSGQMLFLSSRFVQQAKDTALIQKEVMNEYNTKFVHPRLNPVVRDVGTQVAAGHSPKGRGFVQVGTPTTLIRKSYVTRSTSQAGHDNTLSSGHRQMVHTNTPRHAEAVSANGEQPRPTFKQYMMADQATGTAPSPMPLSATSANTANYGGNMGIYSHNKSPLKKVMDRSTFSEPASPRNSREMAALEQQGRSTSHSYSGTSRSRAQQDRSIRCIPWPRNDETPAAFSRRRILSPWIQRGLVPFVSLTVLATLTFYLVEMSYFLPPKVSDVAPRQSTSLALPKKNHQPVRRTQTESPQQLDSFPAGWMRKIMLPSRRPERGGTSREQGYWEQMEVEGRVRPRRRLTDSQYSMGDVSVDSSHIARWNVPKDIPKEEQQPSELPREQRVISAKPPDAKQKNRRSWSWSPLKGSDDQISVALPSDGWNGNNNNLTGASSMDSETAAHSTQLQRRDALKARKARRRQRQSLRESGDFLGVQGVNPHTGELDVMSPTDDSSPISTRSHQETVHAVMSTLRDKWKHSRHHHRTRDFSSQGKGSIKQQERKGARGLGKAVRWKRRVGEWSSLQEPDLSPISASPNSRRPSHAVPHLSLEEATPDLSPAIDALTSMNEAISLVEATSPAGLPTPLSRTSSNSTDLHKGGVDLSDSNPQTSSRAMTEAMKAPFLGMVAEREVGEPCTGASMMALSAYPFTRSIPAFPQEFKGMRAMSLSNLDLSLTPLREPIPLSLFDESPLGAISRLRYRDSPTRAKRGQPKGHSNLKAVQIMEANAVKKGPGEVTGWPQEKPVTAKHSTSSPRPHSLLTPGEIKRGMQKRRDQVAILNNQQQKTLSRQKPASRILCEITDNSDETKESVCTPITTITGCNHQTVPLEHHLLSHMVVRPDELSCSSPTQDSSKTNSDKSHTDPSTNPAQSQSSAAEGDELLVELLADITSTKLEEKGAHLRGRRLLMSEGIMPALEDNSLLRSTFTQDHISLATNQWKLSNTKQTAQDLDLSKAPGPAEQQTQMEENPWIRPEREGSDDIASLLDDWEHDQDCCPDTKLEGEEEYGNEWKTLAEWKEYQRQNQKESTTGWQVFLYCLKALAKLYWSTVWPMLDPRTLQVEHDGPMPLWKACLLIVLAAPVMSVGFVVIVQGMKLVRLLAWLLDYADDGAAIWI